MSKENKISELLILKNEIYPQVDLQNEKTLMNQYANIEKFKIRQYRVLAMILLFFFNIFFMSLLGGIFGIDTKTNLFGGVAFAVQLITFFPLLFFMFNYKCPNCGAVPIGKSVSLVSELSYSKGIHPFPKRCECCGFYLSKRTLLIDLGRLG
jgi:hypothetical protein